MKCPRCQTEMKIQREDISNNLKKGKSYKEYKRAVYWCKQDDIWVGIETPIQLVQ